MTEKIKFATVWLDGCSGCHMSFLDIDHRLLDLAPLIDVVWSPLVDIKEFPNVDVVLVEGAVSSEEDLAKIKHVRERAKYLIAMGDCAVTANVPSMRNRIPTKHLTEAIYLTPGLTNPQLPQHPAPTLLPQARPVHEIVKVDLFVPGCPPSNETLYYVISEMAAGRTPDPSIITRFGA